jgi:hypothetical protein
MRLQTCIRREAYTTASVGYSVTRAEGPESQIALKTMTNRVLDALIRDYSVMEQFEYAFFNQGPRTIRAPLRIAFPAFRDLRESPIAGQICHHSQLHDVQAMIEGAREHLKLGSGLLVQRPVAGIKARQIVEQRLNAAVKDLFG